MKRWTSSYLSKRNDIDLKSGAKSKASFHVVGFRLGPQSFNKKLHKPFEWAGSRLAKPASSNIFPSFVLFACNEMASRRKEKVMDIVHFALEGIKSFAPKSRF